MIESSEEEPYPHHTAWVSRCGWNIERMHAYRKTPFDTFFEIAICLYSYRPTRFPFIPSVSALVPRKALGVCMYEYSRSSIYGIHTYVHHKVHTRITTYTYIRSVELNFEGWQELGQSNCEQRAVGWAVCYLVRILWDTYLYPAPVLGGLRFRSVANRHDLASPGPYVVPCNGTILMTVGRCIYEYCCYTLYLVLSCGLYIFVNMYYCYTELMCQAQSTNFACWQELTI